MKTDTTLHASESNVQTAPVSKGSLWAGRVMSTLAALFLFMDGGMKLFKPPVVVQATVQLGYPESTIVGIGIRAARLDAPVRYSANVALRCDFAHRLFGWCRGEQRPRCYAIIQHPVPGSFRCSGLGRPLVEGPAA